MFKVTLAAPRQPDGNNLTVDVMVPALPRVGDHIAHDVSGINGYVRGVGFWFDEGDALEIEVQLK